MKTKTWFWLGGTVAILYYLYTRATVTIMSDVQAINTIAHLPKTINISELVASQKTQEPKLIRVNFSL